MDPNLAELIKFIGPPIASFVAAYYAARERIRVLEVKLEELTKAFDKATEAAADTFEKLEKRIESLQNRLGFSGERRRP